MKPFFLVIHLVSAILKCAIFPVLPGKLRKKLVQSWCIRLLRILKVKVIIHGDPSTLFGTQPYLLVSNHISWLDIHILNSIRPVIFVAKADVSKWPIFGYLASMLGTIFLKREKLSDIKRVIQLMKDKFANQEVVAIFPEGTSSDGKAVLPFKSNLFESAHQAHVDVLPITIQYTENNQYSDRAAFIGDMELIDSIKNILKTDHLVVHVYLSDKLPAHLTRQELASQAHQLVASKA
ncbi:1-acyl-sn-glycerol-3-phosphate acyltransferase [Polynucleobacter sp. AM-26B4]|uniref:lysophospholipid acyltransferase family protein n=1 Tax=Polynucleobacter sp. AM-26B4 TaxID=2689103 RepID=UPI001C0DDE5E|nr:lysophospholipid acyltransferase family protein [Polynucleobacter sp. AM-26B4]MBU3585884.1 1-acyl-sn-glycerol-3-phosphate acyltransferase [Polynucleobacter sp. AM-26B4]